MQEAPREAIENLVAYIAADEEADFETWRQGPDYNGARHIFEDVQEVRAWLEGENVG